VIRTSWRRTSLRRYEGWHRLRVTGPCAKSCSRFWIGRGRGQAHKPSSPEQTFVPVLGVSIDSLPAGDGVNPLDARRPHIDAWAPSPEPTGLSPRTVARRLPALSSWYGFLVELDALIGDPDEVRARLSENIPLRRYGESAEFGQAAAFVLSPAASYITGAMIPIDGGAIHAI
jgi:Enoyl-(Acyl carrier protein) reductase